MKRLVDALASIVRQRVANSIQGRGADKLESRFIFHGPPLAILEDVFEELARDGGIRLSLGDGQPGAILPVLLQLPAHPVADDPSIGVSGRCSETHLLHIRNDPSNASFVALVPPGQHNNRSVSSTTEEFGIAPANNTLHANFDDWWRDGFVQDLLSTGLEAAGLGAGVDEARQLASHAAEAMDEMDPDQGSRNAAWRLLSRIHAIPDGTTGLVPGQALALACGIPPMADGSVSHRRQLGILAQVADEMADGFRTGIERIANGAEEEDRLALRGFLDHIQHGCEVPTAFERATEAFYLPAGDATLARPPAWWQRLDIECWGRLLSDGGEEEPATGQLSLACTNPIIPPVRGAPAIVRDVAELSISFSDERDGEPAEARLAGGSLGREGIVLVVDGQASHVDTPPAGGQKSPITYKVESVGHKAATAKVISLLGWQPGIVVTSRMASKLSPPRKPRRANSGADWESSLSLPGSGRYEMLLLVAPGTRIVEAACVPDDATESRDGGRKTLRVHEIRDGEYQLEIEADAKYQLDVTFLRAGQAKAEACRTYIACEEAKEEGCRSEFERAIKRNRNHLERSDTKSVIQLDRNARSSSLQSWLLEEQHAGMSFRPIVLSDDYGLAWAPPDWSAVGGPILSKALFLHDPRPAPSQFVPPPGFVDARTKIAARIRASTDDQLGLVESSTLGKWLARDDEFRGLVETYVEAYTHWLSSDRDVACWVDAIAVCPREPGGRTLSRVPDAIILSPLHPLRLAWHCLAQQVLHDSLEGDDPAPCPAASILDPDRVPDILAMSLQSPGAARGIDRHDFISVESNSDYWSVLWNGARLGMLAAKSQQAPFDSTFGLKIGGISSGFSPAQVGRALEDVSDLLAAKPVTSVVVASAGGSTDACNEGLASWCTKRFGNGDRAVPRQGVGPRMMNVYDTRQPHLRPDQATISNLSEDTHNQVRWFEKQPRGTRPDLGIIAQLDSAQPEAIDVGSRSPLGIGGLLRHRVRRQLPGAFLSESRQSRPRPPSGNTFANKVATCMLVLEACGDEKMGLQFAPDVHAISAMLQDRNASFVAVSSSAIDPACFLGGWIKGTYLWDYDLPSYSQRAGDTNGYYLLSRIRESDRDALERVLKPLLGNKPLDQRELEDVLLEVARRGIPTVRGLSGDDTGATGDLGLFLAVRLLQDEFRLAGNTGSLVPVLAGTGDEASMALVIPVDPFRGYLSDLARSLGNERKEQSLSRPDLLVVGIHVGASEVRIHLTPVEVKCRQGSTFGSADARDALGQAKALSTLFRALQDRASRSVAWKLTFQHLLLSMVGFGLRVYSQHQLVSQQPKAWATYHERIAAAILEAEPTSIDIDEAGRLIVVDGTPESLPRDHDGDGFPETIVIAAVDAARMVSGDPRSFYDMVRSKVGNWGLMPASGGHATAVANAVHDGQAPPPPVRMAPRPSDVALAGTSSQAAAGPVDAAPSGTSSPATGAPADTAPALPAAGPTGLAGSDDCKGIVLAVGQTVDGFQPRKLALNVSDTRLNQLNIGVVGDLGTGKTQLLKSLILQITRAKEENRGIKPRFLIFDYKRDYSSPEFVATTGAKVVKPMNLPLNLFDTKTIGDSLAPWLDRFRFFADVLDKVYSGIGPVQRDKLKAAVRNAYETCKVQGREPTIYDIHAEYRQLLGGKSDSPMAIIDDLVDMEVFERDPGKTGAFDDFLQGVVVVSLDAMGQDDRSKNMLVAIMLNMFYENMLKTPKRPFQGTDPQLRVIDSYLLVDEADNIMRYEFDVLRKLLLQGREFGTGVVLASQYLRHFKVNATDYREPLLTWFIHKVPNVAPAELGALGFTSDLADLSERVKTLQNHHCLYKSFDVAGEVIRGKPFYELLEDEGKEP
jgi:DNA phosphorothioation-dependent restriction protein DptH